ncbi:nucleotide-binding domain-containing protein [Aureobasidium pullulans]|uniref:NADPH:adrenodoxin oxidoreductase, mitochondrial n=1 Tax=Aureobasidium pullulans TaxID=5580 RepID=A0A4S9C302_AURPU|nr:nucleotide-binding domain-containing protein [Aureobasidium pullulans]
MNRNLVRQTRRRQLLGNAILGGRCHARNPLTSRLYSTADSERPFRCAVIGSGPAGFYAAYRMLQKMPNARVDMYEALPSPYGLVRFGVAPDHPEVKNCIDKFVEVASHPSFTFIGNTTIGSAPGSLPLSSIAPHYNALLFSYGASRDRKLGIAGEDLSGVLSARAFVGWYNGLPEYANLAPALDSSDEAVVIGQGNVALDVARVLLSPLDRLRNTDMTEAALETLSKSRVRRVRVVGRRGPLQAPYTIKEVRELMQLPGVAFNPADSSLFPTETKKLPRPLMRIAQVIEKGSPTSVQEAARQWELLYMRSPVAFEESTSSPGSLSGVRFDEMEFTQDPCSVPLSDLDALRSMRVKKKDAGKQEVLTTNLAFRSVGYQSEPLEGFEDLGITFDQKMGIIPNDLYGRVLSPDSGPGALGAGHIPGMYCAGWVKRGPTGVIASTMQDAFTSADIVAKDWADGVTFIGSNSEPKAGWNEVKKEAEKRGIRSIGWEDWLKIDKEEKRRGQAKGKEREKCHSVQEMLKILDA